MPGIRRLTLLALLVALTLAPAAAAQTVGSDSRHVALNSFRNTAPADTWETVGEPAPGWAHIGGHGFLRSQPAPGLVAIQECQAGDDRFLSWDAGCEGQAHLRLAGHAFASKPQWPPTVSLYRCHESYGERQTRYYVHSCSYSGPQSRLLGYVPTLQRALNRYHDAARGTHWVSAGVVGEPGYRYESTLGFLVETEREGTVPLYSCFVAANSQQYVSRDSACEGGGNGTLQGHIYEEARGTYTTPLYRCLQPNGSPFAQTATPCAEPNRADALIGHVLNVEIDEAPASPDTPPVPPCDATDCETPARPVEPAPAPARPVTPVFRLHAIEVRRRSILSLRIRGLRKGSRMRITCRKRCARKVVASPRIRRSGALKVRVPARVRMRLGAAIEVRVSTAGRLTRFTVYRLALTGAKRIQTGCLSGTRRTPCA